MKSVKAVLFAALLVAACRPGPADEPERPAPPASTADPSHVRIPLETLGLSDAQRFNAQPTLSFPFFARSDRVLTAAVLTLRFGEIPDSIRQVDVSVNQENVAVLKAEAMRSAREVRIPIDAAVIGDKNLLTLRLHTSREGPCGKIPPESWKVIRSGELEMESAALPLPDELSLLPLPFVDRHFDSEATVQVVLPPAPDARILQQAARVAGWFGVDTGVALRFVVFTGALPPGPSVVLIDGPRRAAALGLPAPDGASLRMIDHPASPRSNVKLLLVSGRTPDELELAARALAAGSAGRFKGSLARIDKAPDQAPIAPDQAPRWMKTGRPLRFADVPAAQLQHLGVDGARLAFSFRLPPDLWTWPDEFVELDLHWELAVPREVPLPRLDVLFNGFYLARLPDLDPARGETTGEQRLRIHRDKLKGFNELVMYVDYPDSERICTASTAGSGGAQVRLLPDSTLHIERYGLFSPQPDVESFVNDGFPFTRAADLSETAIVLGTPFDTAEAGFVLSAVAQFGSVTGVAGAPAFVPAEAALQAGFDKDLLLLGSVDSNLLLRRWADHMPVRTSEDGLRPQFPVQANEILGLFTGRRGRQELGRARGLMPALQKFSAIAAFESPVQPGRTAVAIESTAPGELRSFAQFRGFADGVVGRGDLLVASGGQRYRFAIGPSFGRGTLDPWMMLRWFLAQHPLLLVPFLLVGVLSLALVLRLRLQIVMRRRLDFAEPEPS